MYRQKEREGDAGIERERDINEKAERKREI